MRASRVGLWALGLGAVGWAAALFLLPELVFPIGALICHQRPERSFFVGGVQLPVCARCTGLYVGAAVAAPAAVIAAMAAGVGRARWVLAAAALPTAITWTVEFAGLAHFSNVTRFVAALPLGTIGAWLVLGELRAPRQSTFRTEHH